MTSSPPRRWPFVGRHHEVTSTLVALAHPGSVVVLTGPAGSGKTSLARAVAAERGDVPLWIQASDAVADVPFGALAGVADGAPVHVDLAAHERPASRKAPSDSVTEGPTRSAVDTSIAGGHTEPPTDPSKVDPGDVDPSNVDPSYVDPSDEAASMSRPTGARASAERPMTGPPGGAADAGALLTILARRMEASGGLLVVDDGPHLDARTADLLRRLVASHPGAVLVTAREGVAVPAWLEWLWLGDTTHHLELAPLDVADVDELIAIRVPDLDTTARRALTHQIWHRARGNALFVRELIGEVARQVDRGGAASLPVNAPAHLLRVLEARLAEAGDAASDVLRAVAVLGGLPLALAVQRCGPAAVEAAEAAGYVEVGDDARAIVRPGHPLYAEAALGAVGAVAGRAVRVETARLVVDDATATASERLAAVAVLVELGHSVDPVHLVDAARSAFAALDHELAVRIATAALDAGDRFEARLVLGAAHSGAGRTAEADVALRGALAVAADDDERARSAGRLSVHLVAHGTRVEEAEAVLAAAVEQVTDPAASAYLAADRAKLATIRGDLTSVASLAVPDDGDDLARLNAAIAGAYVQAMAGDADACRATVAEALPLAALHRSVLPWSAELVRFSTPFATMLADGPERAFDEARSHLARIAVDQPDTVGTWRFLTGFTAAVGGRLAESESALTVAAGELTGHDLVGARPLALATRAWVIAQAGRAEEARDLLDEALDMGGIDGRVRVQVAVADAWCDLVDGNRVAVGKVLDAARSAAAEGQAVAALIALNDVVRMGGAREAVEPLRGLVRAMPESWLARRVLDRSEVSVSRVAAGIDRLASRLAGRWPVMEAEVQRLRYDVARHTHDEVTSARAALAVASVSPMLGAGASRLRDGLVLPLSERELAVARAVADGARNRDVAEAAGVSVRTVENQLQSVYRKLGVTSRDELAALLPVPPV